MDNDALSGESKRLAGASQDNSLSKRQKLVQNGHDLIVDNVNGTQSSVAQHVTISTTLKIRDCFVKLGRLHESRATSSSPSSVEVGPSAVQRDASCLRSTAVIPLQPLGTRQNDCVIIFMCSLSSSADDGLLDSVKQHWQVDDSRIYKWKETCSGQITMQSILYYLDILSTQLKARSFEAASRTIFDETNTLAAKCSEWIANIEGDESTLAQVAAYRQVKKNIQLNVKDINEAAKELVAVVVETTMAYGLYLRLCQSTDPMLEIRGYLPRYWTELSEWPGIKNGSWLLRYSSSMSSLYRDIEYRSVKKYLKALLSTVTADEVYLLPSDGVIRSRYSPVCAESVTLRLYNACAAMGKQRYEMQRRKVFFIGPCNIVSQRKYVLHALPYLVSCHLTAQTSLTVIFDADKELQDSLSNALGCLPQHAAVRCLATFEDLILPETTLVVEMSFAF